MSFNGSGTFLINTAGQPVVAGTVISSTAFNALTADLATGLSTAITKDGQTTVTANIPMSTYKFTGLGVGSAATDSANLSQVQSTVTKLLTSVSGTDTITAVGAPVVAAYAAGQMFYFVATGDNTGAVTLNIDSLGAKAVTRDGSVALAAGDIKSGEVVVVVYDGTRFQVVSQLNSAGDARFANVSIASSLYVGGVSTFVGNAGFSANVSITSALSVGGVAAITGATTIGGNLTLSGGTANGVLYLNGSKVATSGTALVFDGTNLGIGTTSPLGKLQVKTQTNGNAAFVNSTSVSGGVKINCFNDAGSSSSPFELDGSTLQFNIAAVERMRLDSSGNLGIGTASPATKLNVVGTVTVDGVVDVNGGQIDLDTGQPIRWGGAASSIYAGSGTSDMVFTVGSSERFRVNGSSGNVGIGTSSPTQKLDVNGGAAVTGTTPLFLQRAVIPSFDGQGAPAIDWQFYSTGTTYTVGARIQGLADDAWSSTSAPTSLRFYTAPSGSTSVSERMRISNAGNVGIGTASPTSYGGGYTTLEVAGSVTGVINLKAGSTVYGQMSTEANAYKVEAVGASTSLRFLTNSAERARITSGGVVAVNTTGAVYNSEKLAVLAANNSLAAAFKTNAGATEYTVAVSNTATSGDNLFIVFATESTDTARGSITYNRAGGLVAYNTTSDYRAKDILGPVQNSGATIDALKVYEGQMKGATQSRPMLVAHEAQEHAPYAVTGEKDAVNEDGTPKYQQMDVSALVPLLLAEIQSLRARVAQLETK